MPRDLHRALDVDESARHVPARRLQPGEEIVGTIRQRDTVESQFRDELVMRLIVESDDREVGAIYANHTVLARKLRDLDPQPGDRIAIRRLDDHPEKKYANYRVIVDRKDDAPLPLAPSTTTTSVSGSRRPSTPRAPRPSDPDDAMPNIKDAPVMKDTDIPDPADDDISF